MRDRRILGRRLSSSLTRIAPQRDMADSLFTMLMTKKPGNFAEQVRGLVSWTRGSVPAGGRVLTATDQIVFEDSQVIAFLDKFPQVPGHTLVVPKQQVEKLHELRSGVDGGVRARARRENRCLGA